MRDWIAVFIKLLYLAQFNKIVILTVEREREREIKMIY